MSKQQPIHTEVFRREAIQSPERSGKSVAELARELGSVSGDCMVSSTANVNLRRGPTTTMAVEEVLSPGKPS